MGAHRWGKKNNKIELIDKKAIVYRFTPTCRSIPHPLKAELFDAAKVSSIGRVFSSASIKYDPNYPTNL
jgi:hypothetical protein